jgi:Aerotolerance regulator N-terminal/von Willebrand factor type A domain
MLTLLSPLLIWGTLLGAIPIIIHLLNRRRFRRVEWAPMHYLRLTIQRNRRRIQFEQLLLLLLRIALILILFFYLARPLLNPTGLETWLGSGGRTSQVVLIDDSLSMGYSSGDSTAFSRAKEAAGSLVASIRPQDRCTIVTTSAPRVPVVHEVEGTRRDELLAATNALPISATYAAWPAVLEGLNEVVRSCTYPTKQVTILTDLRKAGWDRSVTSTTGRWQEEGLRVRIVDLGDDEASNMALQGLVPLDRTILSGAASRWEAVIRNDSPRVISGAKAVLRIDDKPIELKLPEIAPREVARVPLSVQFPGSGPHEFSLQLPDDALPGDNQHWAAVPVKDSLLIRLVDGEPSTEAFGSEVDYLAAPLSIGIGAAEAWRVEVVQDQDFLSPRLETPDVLVLANVASITPEEAERLGQMVNAGMGLLIFTGAKLDVGLYNDLLFRQNNKLLPCPLKSLTDETIHGVFIEPLHPSPLEKLLDLKASALERVTLRQIMTVEEPPEGGQVRVLARWNNPARSPAVVERIKGDGRVLLWTTTADRAGNDWPIEPSFVLAVREAVRGTARPTSLGNIITAGERMGRVVQTSQAVSNARLSPPGGGEPLALSAVPKEDAPGKEAPSVVIAVPDTRRAGIYRISWDEGSTGTQQDIYAANPDPRESALERIEAPELKSFLAPLEVEVIRARSNEANMFSSTGREIWHDLAVALAVLLVFESIFATWVGRSR